MKSVYQLDKQAVADYATDGGMTIAESEASLLGLMSQVYSRLRLGSSCTFTQDDGGRLSFTQIRKGPGTGPLKDLTLTEA